MKKLTIITFAGALAACGASPAQVAAQLEAHINGNGVDAAVALFAPDAIVNVNAEPAIKGTERVKAWITELGQKHTHLEHGSEYVVEGANAKVVQKVTNDDYQKLAVAPINTSFELTVQNGKIIAVSMALTPEGQAIVERATAALYNKTLDELDRALNAKSLDEAMALFADDAVLTTPEKSFAGKAEIRAHFGALVAQNVALEKAPRAIAGTKVGWLSKVAIDDWRKAKIAPLEAQMMASLDGGTIKSLSLVWTAEAASKLQQLAATAAAPAAAPKGERN